MTDKMSAEELALLLGTVAEGMTPEKRNDAWTSIVKYIAALEAELAVIHQALDTVAEDYLRCQSDLATSEAARERAERGLAFVYRGSIHQAAIVARICDEQIDQSGALLGRVRRLASTEEEKG